MQKASNYAYMARKGKKTAVMEEEVEDIQDLNVFVVAFDKAK
jgi:hypothetical protein